MDDVLEVFGSYFLEYCIQSGYDRILRVLGRNLRDFLCNLDALHDHLASIYPGMEAPSFRCTESDDGTLFLHYYSQRPDLGYIVIGIVKAVAKDMLGTTVNVKVHQARTEEHDHVTFAIREAECRSPGSSKLGLQEFSLPGSKEKPAHRSWKYNDRDANLFSFCRAFPFHVMFDRNLVIKQAGIALMRVLNKRPDGCLKFTDLFSLMRPRMEFSFSAVYSHINTVFVTRTKPGVLKTLGVKPEDETGRRSSLDDSSSSLRFKGQMVHVPESDNIIFICSPRLSDSSKLKEFGLYFSDIPPHDATRDLFFMSQARRAERELVEKLEETSNDLRKLESRLIENKKRTDELLHSILPKEVAAKLRLNQPVPAENYKLVTILFSDIVGFTALCSSSEVVPMDIVRLLNKLYTYFDMLSGMNDVYKVSKSLVLVLVSY